MGLHTFIEHYHRNGKIIKLIKEKADGYDQQLKQKADS